MEIFLKTGKAWAKLKELCGRFMASCEFELSLSNYDTSLALYEKGLF
jgi:hypothetical protein